MHWSASSLNRIVTSVNELRQRCVDSCDVIKKTSAGQGQQLVFSIAPVSVSNQTVAAIDSGFSVKQFVSIDVMLLRAVGCIFNYADGNISSASYYPSRVPGVSVHYGLFSDQNESTLFKSLTRLNAELSCALQTAKIYSPPLLLLDGSLLPLASDKPPLGSELEVAYEDTMELYSQLFSFCQDNNIQIAGIVKDPRSQRLCSILSSAGYEVPTSSDIFLSDILLSPFERTSTFTYADDVNSSILRDLGQWPSIARGFYLKAGADLPYRVEFMAAGDAEQQASLLASKLLGLGSSHAFAYPSILIEADMRAALTPQEINTVFTSLSSRTTGFAALRTNSRPFR